MCHVSSCIQSRRNCPHSGQLLHAPLKECPAQLLSGNGLQFCSKLSQAVYTQLGVRKVATSAYHPNGNGDAERVNHTMARSLAIVVNERQNDWDIQLPHVEFAYNQSVSAATGLSPHEVHLGRLPRLPLTVIEQQYARGHKHLERDQLERCDLAADRQRHAYKIWCENNTLSLSRVSIAEVQRSRTPSAEHLRTKRVRGFGSITPNPLVGRVSAWEPMTKY